MFTSDVNLQMRTTGTCSHQSEAISDQIVTSQAYPLCAGMQGAADLYRQSDGMAGQRPSARVDPGPSSRPGAQPQLQAMRYNVASPFAIRMLRKYIHSE